MPQSPILVQYAMKSEAQPLLDHFGLDQSTSVSEGFSFLAYSTQLPSLRKLIITVAGLDERHQVDAVGCLPASLQAYLSIQRFAPGLVINAGTAGGFEAAEQKMSEVFCSHDSTYFHSRRIPIPGWREMGLGGYRLADTQSLAAVLGVRRAIISTGDSLDCPPDDLAVMKETSATLKDMEAGAIAWICERTRTPLIALKAVTDFVDHPAPTQEQFFANLQATVRALKLKLVEAIHYLDQNPNDPAWKLPEG